MICKPCPWNFSCPSTTLDNSVETKMEPWVLSCPPGTYGVGANTAWKSAVCVFPCSPMKACLGSDATVIDEYEVSFLNDGRAQWTLSCPIGTYPSRNNSEIQVTECLPCPDGMACSREAIMDPFSFTFNEGPYMIPFKDPKTCPKGMHVKGSSSMHEGQCVR